ncbi:hypothetical protein CKO42_08795 [Lamprobacter modestohalophilus]|uniref:Amidohydrolase-related domain-containing protein n=1 Tax=Lamprobacter modestohalophilus TaxID=1064514 RepID=A0A9X0W7S7_9GAMM|nr:amidohydrolase family protein [Lamprobacter modestohalophilus]MBK1618534.1 hypothetical protein [Lamprobacter modestohalophilus]
MMLRSGGLLVDVRLVGLVLMLAMGLNPWPLAAAAQPLVDAHLHYSGVDAAELPPAQVIALFDRKRIQAAVVSGQPQWAVEALYRAAPDRILPFLSVYRGPADKSGWMHDPDLPRRVAEALRSGIYRGIGEIHLFAEDRQSPVLAALVAIAAEQDLMLQVHGDAAVIEEIFAQAPEVTVLWAHLGTDPRPQVLAPLLARYPRLFVDTSVRDERFVDDQGRLWAQWRKFFIAHQAQVLVGVDTFWTPRWRRFSEVTARIRGWLDQLPPEVAARLAYGNAARLFGLASSE